MSGFNIVILKIVKQRWHPQGKHEFLFKGEGLYSYCRASCIYLHSSKLVLLGLFISVWWLTRCHESKDSKTIVYAYENDVGRGYQWDGIVKDLRSATPPVAAPVNPDQHRSQWRGLWKKKKKKRKASWNNPSEFIADGNVNILPQVITQRAVIMVIDRVITSLVKFGYRLISVREFHIARRSDRPQRKGAYISTTKSNSPPNQNGVTTLMRFELWLTLLLSLVLIRTWNIGCNMLGRVSRDHQRAWNIHSMLKITNLTLSQYAIAITLILWHLKCVHFVFNVCSLMHDSTDYSHFHTKGSQLVYKQPCQIILLTSFSLKSYTISIRGGYFFCV